VTKIGADTELNLIFISLQSILLTHSGIGGRDPNRHMNVTAKDNAL